MPRTEPFMCPGLTPLRLGAGARVSRLSSWALHVLKPPQTQMSNGLCPESPERGSGDSFARDRRIMPWSFGEHFCWVSSFKFQEKWPQEVSWKILDVLKNSTLHRIKVFHCCLINFCCRSHEQDFPRIVLGLSLCFELSFPLGYWQLQW